MSVLSPPRHPTVSVALHLARSWCAGHFIDGAPALLHAVRVALKLGEHVHDVHPELVAAALLHDAPEFAPHDQDLDLLLATRIGPACARTVRALQHEHLLLGQPATSLSSATDDQWTLYASAADKIVSLRSILRRADVAGNQPDYWRSRNAFVALLPYLRSFQTMSAPRLPDTLATELRHLIARAGAAVRSRI